METLAINFKALEPHLNEKTRRLVAAALVVDGDYGEKSKISRATGVSHREIRRGLVELAEKPVKTPKPSTRIRKEGGGRKKATEKDPELVKAILDLVESTTRGEPECRLLWTTKSLRNLETELKEKNYNVSYVTIGSILEDQGYSLQSNKKVLEGSDHPDRNEQFEHINKCVKKHLSKNQPIISVDCKKHELVGNFKNNGQEYHKKDGAPKVKDHDFMDKELGKAIPYGIYDLTRNYGFVNVSITKDTSVFAVQSIRAWWENMGKEYYPDATNLLITADCGGSKVYRRRLWLLEMSKLAKETGLAISVCHFPAGTSKWNKIEHRLFSQITMNWRGRPVTTIEVIISLIAAPITRTGLFVQTKLDKTECKTGLKVDEDELADINIKLDNFHGEWNYTFLPD